MVQLSARETPNVIFLDAVGTLFGVKGGVGEAYRQVALQFGVDVPAAILNRAFFQSFQAAGSAAFPDTPAAALSEKEFAWWRAIATQTFQQAGVLEQFRDFDAFFAALFAYFATAEPWFVYPDVRPTLEQWHNSGIELGVLSNFDSRLYGVLQSLGLANFFSSVTISTESGVAKPDSQIFHLALHKHHCPASLAWHIGDSFEEDYQAARSAGLRGIWLRRNESGIG
jgi:putative hydrolase of the HAD superfamily